MSTGQHYLSHTKKFEMIIGPKLDRVNRLTTLNFVINLPDVKNITKWLDSILTEVSIIKTFYTLEFILSVQSQICSIVNIVKLLEN